ncbi:MAG TPA: VOC family protein [Ktedonobacteraceae bacterium]|nr:VOC family protein [Ktedonobacteraceae bacterium]HEV2663167.1 VOC family protein [Ktedonobacteraceae bacterium]
MITGIGHVAFRISNLEASLNFYCNKLGFREAFRLEQEGKPSPWIVYIQIAPGHFIELFPIAASETLASTNPELTYSHFCLLVDNLATTLRDLATRGLDVPGSPVQGLDHNWQYWIKDPDGNAIELMQIMPASPQAAADATMQASDR